MPRPAFVRAVAPVVFLLLSSQPLSAQIKSAQPDWVGSMRDEYERIMQLTGARPLSSLMIRPVVRLPKGAAGAVSSAAQDPWRWTRARHDSARGPVVLEVFDPSIRVVNNSAVPWGGNDGAMWAGRGTSAMVELGARAVAGPVTVQVVPGYTWSENRGFVLGRRTRLPAGMSTYADTWLPQQIDRPQRYGESAYSRVDAGQSSIRADWNGATIGFSNQNMWWGPGVENSLLMTNNAPGFRHAFVGTGAPVDIWIGKLEAVHVQGRLLDSKYWRDSSPNADRRWFSALVMTLEPRGAPGLYLGVARTFTEYGNGPKLGSLKLLTETFWKKNVTRSAGVPGNDRFDQGVSLFGRWAFPQVGAEVYGEWGRADHSWDTRDFIAEPENSSASLIGLQKVFTQRSGFLLLRSELLSLEASRNASVRSAGHWYGNTGVSQGYTNSGQILGAWIGPGGSRQSFVAEWWRKWGRVGAHVERNRLDTDAFFDLYSTFPRDSVSNKNHDTVLGGGIDGAVLAGPLTVSLELNRFYERNRYSIWLNDLQNYQVRLRGEWALGTKRSWR